MVPLIHERYGVFEVLGRRAGGVRGSFCAEMGKCEGGLVAGFLVSSWRLLERIHREGEGAGRFFVEFGFCCFLTRGRLWVCL